MTATIINLSSKRQTKHNSMIKVIEYVLSQDQSIVIGTSSVERRLEELRCWFPNARLEVVELGIKISNG